MTPEAHYAEAQRLAQQGGELRVDSNPQLYLATALLANTHALLAQGVPLEPAEAYAAELRDAHLGRDGWLLTLLVAVVLVAVVWLATR